MKHITIVGRLWTDTHNNTYHSAEVFVDGEFLAKENFKAGYGKQFVVTGLELLRDSGAVQEDEMMELTSTATVVKRKKDL